MRHTIGLAAILALAASAGARPQGKADRRPAPEDERIGHVLTRVRSSFDAEREKFVTGLRKYAAANGVATGNGDDEFEGWFRALAGGKDVWRRDAAGSKPLADLFRYLTEQTGATGDQITRGQFIDYARLSLAEGAAPPWKSVERQALSEANKLFNELDRDRDGRLSRDEMSDALRAERRQWDKDGDGFIDRVEYRAFFLSRLQRAFDKATPKGGATARGGQPDGRPAWFTQLDVDGDGQVSLFEWRASGWSIADFQRLDRNGDGLLTAAEVLSAVAQAKARGVADELLTRQLPADFRKKGGGGR